ncbi:MAG TPA: hypothetical protein VHI99_24365 [Vicinamibacterales bacterium]|jgi:hypothetical protein|nr:hypothetical protein [Vicinamibacterales bacterium]
MAGKIKPWIWIVAGIFACGILCVVAIAGAGFYFFTRHVETHETSPAAAARDFEQVKERFSGQKPLIELDTKGRFLKSNLDRPAPPNATRPKDLYVLAFDPDDGRIVKVSIPFWLLRLKMRGATIDLNGNRMDLEDLKLTVEDLERFGPTLIVDHSSASGDHVLVWSQ